MSKTKPNKTLSFPARHPGLPAAGPRVIKSCFLLCGSPAPEQECCLWHLTGAKASRGGGVWVHREGHQRMRAKLKDAGEGGGGGPARRGHWLGSQLRTDAESKRAGMLVGFASPLFREGGPIFSIEHQRDSSPCLSAYCYLFSGTGCLLLFPEALMGGGAGEGVGGEGCRCSGLRLISQGAFCKRVRLQTFQRHW